MLLHKAVEHDSRVRREARALVRAGHEVTIVQLADGPTAPVAAPDGFALVSARPAPALKRLLPLRLYRLAYGAMIIGRARAAAPDAVHAHDAAMLAPGWVAARLCGAALVYDTHELATGVPYRSRGWALLVDVVERLLVRRCAAIITVSGGIADAIQRRYGLRRRPLVLRNVCDLPPPESAAAPDLRAQLGIGSEPLILHQGAPAAARGCEALVRALPRLERGHVVFLGDSEPGYAGRLRALAGELGVGARVHLLPTVPGDRLLAHTAQADIGVSLLEDTCENHRLALPNKVFEYMAAGVPVVTSDLPELSRLVREHGIGWTADPSDPVALAQTLKRALAEAPRDGLEEHIAQAARTFAWPREAAGLTRLYAALEGASRP